MLQTNLNIEEINDGLSPIIHQILKRKRIDQKQALILYHEASLSLLGSLANAIREDLHGDVTYFNKNIHIEPTNICLFDCKFCSYSRLLSKKNEAWEYTQEEMIQILKKYLK